MELIAKIVDTWKLSEFWISPCIAQAKTELNVSIPFQAGNIRNYLQVLQNITLQWNWKT